MEKTYKADVAFEAVRRGDIIVSEETQRLTALLGAGYIHEVSGPVYAVTDVREDDLRDEDVEPELLERFEDLDVVEVAAPKPRKRAAKAVRIEPAREG